MSGNFDWQTEEDGQWDGSLRERERRKDKRARRRWALPLATLLIIIAAAALVAWQVQKRVAAAESTIRDEVVSSYNLIRQANEDGDIELFRNLLSGTDLEWAAAQQELFAGGWLYDLSPYGLGRKPLGLSEIEVTLAPELNSAELSAVAVYRLTGGAGPETVRLKQTSVFRKGARWVWSPPAREFWAGESSAELRYLTVTYPVRDESLAQQLATDLDSLLAKICGDDVSLACPADLTVLLQLSSEPDALVETSQQFTDGGIFSSRQAGRAVGRHGLELTLPTPSLIGLPLDDVAYQALLNGYGAHMAMALAGRFAEGGCCGTEARMRAATRQLFAEVGLDPWFGLDLEDGGLADARPRPTQVALLCSNGFERRQRLFVLDLPQMTWQEKVLGPDLMAVKSLPGDEGVLLLAQQAAEDELRSQVWRYSAAGAQLLFDEPVSPEQAQQISWELMEQQGLLVVEVPNLREGYSRYFTIDLAACGHGECPLAPQSTVNRPVWSPDGSQLLVRAYGLLWSRVGASMVPVSDGSAPFWIDEENFGYVRAYGQEQAVVQVQAEATQSEQVVLTSGDLRSALSSQIQPGRLVIARVIVSPLANSGAAGKGAWYVLAFEVGRDERIGQARFFEFDPQTRDISELPYAGRLSSFNLSPAGDKMAMGGFAEESGQWAITVAGLNMAEVATVTLAAGGSAEAAPSYSWSPDESWLLVLEQGVLTLFNPQSRAIYTARPPEASCVQAAWYDAGAAP